MNKIERKAFEAGFDAGYAKGQSDAGEGGYWLVPAGKSDAWELFKKPKKKHKKLSIPSSINIYRK